MDYQTAAKIAAEYAPKLHIDEINPVIPDALVVRKSPDQFAMPFSIHLPHSHATSDQTPEEAAEAEKKMLTDALDSALKALA